MAESLNKVHTFDNRLFSITTLPIKEKPPTPVVKEKSAVKEKNPRICVICKASYHLELLHGVWIDMTDDIEIINNKISEMLAKSPVANSTEWSIFTSEGLESIAQGLNNESDIEKIHHKVLFLATYGEWSLILLDYFDDDMDLAEEAIVNHYQGKFKNELDFAISLFDKGCGVILSEQTKLYIDYESFKEDIFKNEYFFIEYNNEIYVFTKVKEW